MVVEFGEGHSIGVEDSAKGNLEGVLVRQKAVESGCSVRRGTFIRVGNSAKCNLEGVWVRRKAVESGCSV